MAQEVNDAGADAEFLKGEGVQLIRSPRKRGGGSIVPKVKKPTLWAKGGPPDPLL